SFRFHLVGQRFLRIILQLNPTAPQISYRQYLRERYGPETIQNFKKLEVLSTKYAQSANSLTFLHKCREQNLIPRGLRLKTTIQCEKANRIIRTAEESLVREQIQFHRRLNFALTPKDIPTLDIITSIEETCQKLSEDVSNEFRIRSKIILEKPLKIKSNISKEEMLSLKELKNGKDIKILPADKGNATVIMNTADYNSKISNLITEEKLTTINIDSTELLVSFDVVSLFTNVPVDKTLSIVRNKLENDNNLKDRTKLNVSAFMELLTLCIKTTYFQLENDFYQ
ncbi:hypothetical protein NQ315_003576, partial [Exocentrus adspersus]